MCEVSCAVPCTACVDTVLCLNAQVVDGRNGGSGAAACYMRSEFGLRRFVLLWSHPSVNLDYPPVCYKAWHHG